MREKVGWVNPVTRVSSGCAPQLLCGGIGLMCMNLADCSRPYVADTSALATLTLV